MESLLTVFRTSTKILNVSLAGLSDDVARVRSRGDEGPSISWTLGHLLDSRIKILALLGDERPNPWHEQFGDTPATDGEGYPTIVSMLAEWAWLNAMLETAASASSAAIEQPLGSAGIHGESNVRDRLAFLAWHEGYHLGVIGAARKAAGLLGPAELVREAARNASRAA